MGRSIDSVSVGADSTHTVVAANGSVAIATMANGTLPKFVLVQAVPVQGDATAAIVGQWLTWALGELAADGDPLTETPLVVGNEPLLVLVHGYGFFKLGWPADATATSIKFVQTPLENQ